MPCGQCRGCITQREFIGSRLAAYRLDVGGEVRRRVVRTFAYFAVYVDWFAVSAEFGHVAAVYLPECAV